MIITSILTIVRIRKKILEDNRETHIYHLIEIDTGKESVGPIKYFFFNQSLLDNTTGPWEAWTKLHKIVIWFLAIETDPRNMAEENFPVCCTWKHRETKTQHLATKKKVGIKQAIKQNNHLNGLGRMRKCMTKAMEYKQ